MKIILLILCNSICFSLFFMPSTFASENTPVKEKSKAVSTGDKIYIWIDEKGNRIYSDVPHKGAEVMEIEKGTDYTSPDNSTPDWNIMKPKVVIDEGDPYTHFAIVSPSNNATVRNNSGTVQIALDIRPTLNNGDKIKLEIDGVAVENSGSSIISLSNVDRGTHTVVAYIVGAKGKVVATTPTVTIHMHRTIQRAKGN
ncbi:MAG: DUF4124 domain-containing protein [Gammaproteobacteria bacterium]|nr:DUF4124 domain-containing protein [Gammaproteobacteria bacterium]